MKKLLKDKSASLIQKWCKASEYQRKRYSVEILMQRCEDIDEDDTLKQEWTS